MAMSDRTIPKEILETGVAFRAGVKGLPFTGNSGRSVSCMFRPTPSQALTNDIWRLSRSCLVSPIRLLPMKQGGHCG